MGLRFRFKFLINVTFIFTNAKLKIDRHENKYMSRKVRTSSGGLFLGPLLPIAICIVEAKLKRLDFKLFCFISGMDLS